MLLLLQRAEIVCLSLDFKAENEAVGLELQKQLEAAGMLWFYHSIVEFFILLSYNVTTSKLFIFLYDGLFDLQPYTVFYDIWTKV